LSSSLPHDPPIRHKSQTYIHHISQYLDYATQATNVWHIDPVTPGAKRDSFHYFARFYRVEGVLGGEVAIALKSLSPFPAKVYFYQDIHEGSLPTGCPKMALSDRNTNHCITDLIYNPSENTSCQPFQRVM